MIEYLRDPPDAATLAGLIEKLDIRPQDLVRRKEYAELGLPETDDADELIRLMVENPKIIERPIAVCGAQAALGRPPENVLGILPK